MTKQQPAPVISTPALQLSTVLTQPATVAACARDYAQGAAARAGLTRTAQRQYPNPTQ